MDTFEQCVLKLPNVFSCTQYLALIVAVLDFYFILCRLPTRASITKKITYRVCYMRFMRVYQHNKKFLFVCYVLKKRFFLLWFFSVVKLCFWKFSDCIYISVFHMFIGVYKNYMYMKRYVIQHFRIHGK